MEKYIKYQHIEKLQSSEVSGIMDGECYIFPKIDGTNAHVWYDDDIGIRFGSRKRELSLDNDNAGFMKENIDNQKLFDFVKRLRGHHVFGEWLVPHSLKSYEQQSWRKFYVFDIFNPETGRHMHYESWKLLANDCGIEYIPPQKIIKNPSEEQLIVEVENNKYLLPDGYKGKGEGIVIKNYSFVNRFGRQIWAKLVASDFKTKHRKEMGAPRLDNNFLEEKMIEELLTQDICDKVLANIKNEVEWTTKLMPRLLNTVFYDFVKENAWDFVKKYKDPTINFKLLRRFCFARTKKLLQEAL